MRATTRFSHPNGASFDVLARDGKTGISVFARVRETGKKAVNCASSVFPADKSADAQTYFDKLVSDATKKGWVLRTANTGSRFTEVPSPTALPASTDKVPGKPVAVKTGPKAVKK
jgi:hypothetical protein